MRKFLVKIYTVKNNEDVLLLELITEHDNCFQATEFAMIYYESLFDKQNINKINNLKIKINERN